MTSGFQPKDGITIGCFDTRAYLYTGTEYRIPCNATAVELGQHSSCCGPHDMCMTNGLCKEQGEEHEKDDFYWSNGCTDSTFNDPACPRYCMKPDERNGTNALVRYCLSTGDWCCVSGPGRDNDDDCCDEESRRFKAKDQAPAPRGVYATMSFLGEDVTSTRTLAAVTSPSTASTSATISTTITSSTPSTTPTESALSSPTSTGSNTGLKVGLGVGLSLGIVGLIAVAVMLALNRRKRKHGKSAEELPWANADIKYAYGAHGSPLAEMGGEGVSQEVPAVQQSPVELGDTGRK